MRLPNSNVSTSSNATEGNNVPGLPKCLPFLTPANSVCFLATHHNLVTITPDMFDEQRKRHFSICEIKSCDQVLRR